MLDRSGILSAQDAKIETVQVPEWGGSVGIRVMRTREREEWETWCMSRESRNGKPADYRGFRVSLLIRTLCDNAGELLFSEDDTDALQSKSGAVIDRLFDEARRVNALTGDAIEELEKNSASGPSADSGIG